MGSASGAQSTSSPTDVTPEAFKRLQEPFASVLAQLIGFDQPTTTGDTGGTTTAGTTPVQQAAPTPLTVDQIRANTDAERESLPLPFPGGTTGGGGGGNQDFAPAGDPTDVLRGIPQGPDTTAAPLGGREQGLLDLLFGQATGDQPQSPAVALLESTTGGDFLPSKGGDNPFLDDQIKSASRPILEGLEELLTRVLPGRFTQAGQFTQPEGSSAFDRSAAIATRGVASALGDVGTKLAFDNFEAERGRQQAAAIATPAVSQAELNTLFTNLQAQALPRLIEQQGLEAGTEAFNRQMTNLLQVLAIAQGASQPLVAQESQSSSKGASITG